MPNQFDHNTVQQYGGVAWAKEQATLLDPGAIDEQIQGYSKVKASLNQIVDTLNTANASIQSAWTGDAATAASQTFTSSSNHAQNVVTTVNNTITQLQTAKTAATTAKAAMASVPDEKPVPSGGLFSGFTNTVSDIFTGTDPKQQAEQHNTAARTQAADVLNKLSTSYDTAANNMTSIAGTGTHDSGFQTTTPTGGFNLGSGSYSSGSGAAASYSGASSGGGTTTARTATVGGVTNGVFEDSHTSLQSATTLPTPETSTPIDTGNLNTSTTTTTTEPIFGGIGGGLSEPTETGKLSTTSGDNVFGENGPGGRSGSKSKLGSSNVFGEDGFGSESGAGGSSRRGSSSLGMADGEGELGGSGAGRGGGMAGGSEEQQPGMQRGMGGGGRGGAGGAGEEELGSSKYSRGRFLGGEEAGSAGDEWVQPSVGGDESLLVKGGGRGSGTGRVASAYDGATDADGNPLHMMRGAGRRSGNRDDEEDERGERPDYLKEDPEWWQSAQRVAPPVVE